MRQVLDEETDGLEAIEIVLRYIFLVREDPPPEGTVQQIGDRVSPEIQETFMSYAQKLKQEGWEKATEAALLRARSHTLRLLVLKFRDLPREALDRVQQATLDELELWDERILFATSIAQVFETPER